jgi:hypothetical protein
MNDHAAAVHEHLLELMLSCRGRRRAGWY